MGLISQQASHVHATSNVLQKQDWSHKRQFSCPWNFVLRMEGTNNMSHTCKMIKNYSEVLI